LTNKAMKNKKNFMNIVYSMLAIAVLAVLVITVQGENLQGYLRLNTTKQLATGDLKPAARNLSAEPLSIEPKPVDAITKGELAKLIVATKNADVSNFKNCAPDVMGKWYEKYACYLVSEGIMVIASDGKFHGEMTLTRAEGAKVFTIAFFKEASRYAGKAKIFSDVNITDWHYVFVMTLAQSNVLDVKAVLTPQITPGMPTAKPQFRPIDLLTRKSAILWAQKITSNVLNKNILSN